MSTGPDCYVKGEGVVHKKNGPALKKCRTCTERLYFYVNKSIVVWASICIEWYKTDWLVEEGFLWGH